MKKIILCGYTGSGKSTVGKALANMLGLHFYDTDQMLAEKYGADIPTLYRNYGENGFRALETQLAEALLTLPDAVIATGGGFMTVPRNVEILKDLCTIIYIHRPFEDCYRYLSRHADRPIIKNHSKEELLERYTARAASYEACADYIIHNTSAPAAAAKEICDKLTQSHIF